MAENTTKKQNENAVKTSVDWHKCDVDYYSDRKIIRLSTLTKGLGHCVYDYIVKEAYKNSYYLDLREDSLEDLSFVIDRATGCPQEQVISIIEILFDIKLLNREMFENHNVLTSKRIQKEFNFAQEKQRRVKRVEEYSLLPEEEQTRSATNQTRSATEQAKNNTEQGTHNKTRQDKTQPDQTRQGSNDPDTRTREDSSSSSSSPSQAETSVPDKTIPETGAPSGKPSDTDSEQPSPTAANDSETAITLKARDGTAHAITHKHLAHWQKLHGGLINVEDTLETLLMQIEEKPPDQRPEKPWAYINKAMETQAREAKEREKDSQSQAANGLDPSKNLNSRGVNAKHSGNGPSPTARPLSHTERVLQRVAENQREKQLVTIET